LTTYGKAGANAAIHPARKGIRTGIVAERFGGQVLDDDKKPHNKETGCPPISWS